MGKFIIGLLLFIIAYLSFKFMYFIYKIYKPNREISKKPEFKPVQKKSSIDKSKAVDADYKEIE